jgi:ADP-heptose:LPS heptosyltransferase
MKILKNKPIFSKMLNKVLIVKLGALGDVIMSTPLVSAIRKHHPKDQIVLLTTQQFSFIFNAFPGISIKDFDRHNLYDTLKIVQWIRSSNFTHVYDLQGSTRTGMLSLFSKARVRAGNHDSICYTHFPEAPWQGQQHIFDRLCLLLKTCDIDVQEHLPILRTSKLIEDKITSWLIAHNVKTPYIIMHAGASPLKPEKRWPYFSELALYFQSKNLPTVWIGSKDDESLNHALTEVTGINASMAFDIFELAELGRRAKCAVTNDSGPMHILAAANIPVFGLFGPTSWKRNHALGQKDNVITTTGVGTREKSLSNLSADRVIDAISSKLAF